jgi:hypothetical protein
MYFTVGKKRHKGSDVSTETTATSLCLADVTMEIKACNLPKAVKLYYIKLSKLNSLDFHGYIS